MVKQKPIADPEAVAALRTLAQDNVVSSVAKLHALAQRLGVKHTTADLTPALAEDVGKQVLAPVPKFRGVSAATGPGSALQADLAVFPNGKAGAHHYFLLVGDTFTRKAWAEPLRYKTAEATNKELKSILQEVPGKGKGATLTTDDGGEFKRIESVLKPLQTIHREKHGRNDIAVVDRMMQTLKVRLGHARANEGASWKGQRRRSRRCWWKTRWWAGDWGSGAEAQSQPSGESTETPTVEGRSAEGLRPDGAGRTHHPQRDGEAPEGPTASHKQSVV